MESNLGHESQNVNRVIVVEHMGNYWVNNQLLDVIYQMKGNLPIMKSLLGY